MSDGSAQARRVKGNFNYTQITRTKPWRHLQVVRFDSSAFGVCVWRRGASVRLFARTLMFESRDPWDNIEEDAASKTWGFGCKRSWRRKDGGGSSAPSMGASDGVS